MATYESYLEFIKNQHYASFSNARLGDVSLLVEELKYLVHSAENLFNANPMYDEDLFSRIKLGTKSFLNIQSILYLTKDYISAIEYCTHKLKPECIKLKQIVDDARCNIDIELVKDAQTTINCCKSVLSFEKSKSLHRIVETLIVQITELNQYYVQILEPRFKKLEQVIEEYKYPIEEGTKASANNLINSCKQPLVLSQAKDLSLKIENLLRQLESDSIQRAKLEEEFEKLGWFLNSKILFISSLTEIQKKEVNTFLAAREKGWTSAQCVKLAKEANGLVEKLKKGIQHRKDQLVNGIIYGLIGIAVLALVITNIESIGQVFLYILLGLMIIGFIRFALKHY